MLLVSPFLLGGGASCWEQEQLPGCGLGGVIQGPDGLGEEAPLESVRVRHVGAVPFP